jgi:Zn-dependent peptidase ImmA (M78 family)
MPKAFINNEMVRWAVDRAGFELGALSDRLGVAVDRVAKWIEGEDAPTFRQAQQLASILHVPFGFLFLDKPPVDDLPIPDLRTLGSDPARNLDVNFRDLLKDVLFKRDWYRDFVEEVDGESLAFVGRFSVNDDAKTVAADMRHVLFGQTGEPPAARNWEAYLSELMKAADAAGIWVMRNGVVGSNTRRPLSVRQFRGFAISDPMVPLVFINGRDAKAAQIFTLAHEFAHIWVGESGISNVQIGEVDYGVQRSVERRCNQIAAEFLVPERFIRETWQTNAKFADNLDWSIRRFRVSRVVIARRAFDLGLCTEDEYRRLYASEKAQWDKDDEADGGGGDFYKTLPVRNGSRFTSSVVSQAISGRLLLRHAAALLNTQPASLVKFHQKRQAA